MMTSIYDALFTNDMEGILNNRIEKKWEKERNKSKNNNEKKNHWKKKLTTYGIRGKAKKKKKKVGYGVYSKNLDKFSSHSKYDYWPQKKNKNIFLEIIQH